LDGGKSGYLGHNPRERQFETFKEENSCRGMDRSSNEASMITPKRYRNVVSIAIDRINLQCKLGEGIPPNSVDEKMKIYGYFISCQSSKRMMMWDSSCMC